VFIPLFWRGKVVSWTTRSISPDASLRYVNAKPEQEAVSMKTLLYGEEHCNNAVIVHEGPTDAWRTGCGAVATMGATYTKAQILRLSKYPKRIICFDSESDAQKRALALCDTLKVFSGTTLRVVLDAKDAGSATDKEIRLLRKMLR
jgi:DNA primase